MPLNDLKTTTVIFLKIHIEPLIGKPISGLTDDELSDLVPIIIDRFEVPLSAEGGEETVEDQRVLKEASNAVTDISSQPWY